MLDLCFCKLVCGGVIRQECPLRCTGPHGQVGVHQQVREAGGEVGDKVIRDWAQSLLHLSRQLSVMVFLMKEGQELTNRKDRFSLETWHKNSFLPCFSLHAAGLWLIHLYRSEIFANLPKEEVRDKASCVNHRIISLIIIQTGTIKHEVLKWCTCFCVCMSMVVGFYFWDIRWKMLTFRKKFELFYY